MKHINILFLVLGILMLVLTACSEKNVITNPLHKEIIANPIDQTVMAIKTVNNMTTADYPIWAGQNINAGTLSVTNDNQYLYVTYTTINGWMLTETHVQVAKSLSGIPQTSKGIPIPGQFTYSMVHNPPVITYTYTIALADYNLQVGDMIYIAAHAVVVNGDYPNGTYQQQTGWGGNIPGPGPRWWYYISYTIIPYNNDNGGDDEFNAETAMMRMYDNPNDFTYHWGTHPWFSYVKMTPNASPRTFYFYASQTYRVGEVEIWKDGSYLYVQTNLDNTYEMAQSHLNVQLTGYSGPPSFGLFPYTMTHDPRVTTYTYQVPWQSSWDNQELNIALHGEVGPF